MLLPIHERDNVISPCLCCAKSHIWQDPVNLGVFIGKLWFPAIHVQSTQVYEWFGLITFSSKVQGSCNFWFLGPDGGRKYILPLHVWACVARRRWWWWWKRNVQRWKGGRNRSNGLQHSLLLLMDILSQNGNLLLHGHLAIRKHGDCSHSLSQLLIERSHRGDWEWLIGGGEKDRGFRENRRCLTVMGEWHDEQE